MGSNRSVRKGKRFEERIAKIFRKCWGLRKHECHRAQSSGTYQVDYSDIIFSPDSIRRPHLVVECKKRSKVSANQLVSLPSDLPKWWEQLTRSANKYKQHFGVFPVQLLVFAVDGMRPLVIFDLHQLNTMELDNCNLILSKHPFELPFFIKKGGYIGTWLDLFLSDFLSPKSRAN